MSISCIKKCIEGDVIIFSNAFCREKYLVTQKYVDEVYLDYEPPGYLLLRHIGQARDTFICGRSLLDIEKIIKRPDEKLS